MMALAARNYSGGVNMYNAWQGFREMGLEC